MDPSSPPYVAELPTGSGERRHACSANDDHGGVKDDDYFEFTPLLPQRRRQRSSASGEWRPRTADAAACRGTAVVHAVLTQPPPMPQRAPRRSQAAVAAKSSSAPGAAARRVRWHEMAFGSVRVPAAMDMGEIRRRLQARRRRLADGEGDDAAAGWAPWRLIRSLSCKGVEAVAVAAAAAPVRLM
ncbi:hypothetical protein E2562_027442 [Oryza meyeriana var. granulata]|uniref:Uncharacterized protein n=1 Tax=Oryza meyeriana var. granulata TaxID=110450 RepID=A0A6G1CIX8_9ORYZ|nr:hypothetical protein E2562_027442 [Oryza meyeriana var. granulata]